MLADHDIGIAEANDRCAQAVVDAALAVGVREVVISPGARNTPLVVAFHRCTTIKKTVILDERGAGFFALGAARAQEAPVALICTSGSALANYYPAVVEAFHSTIPLLLITADRPEELQDRDAPQTMNQTSFFGAFVRADGHLEAPTADSIGSVYRGSALTCFQSAVDPIPGPVQLNCGFRKPLWHPDAVGARAGQTMELTSNEPLNSDVDQTFLHACEEAVRGAQKGVFICGTDAFRWGGRDELITLAEAWGWPVLCEAASQGRYGAASSSIIEAYETILRCSEDTFTPDLVIRIGRPSLAKPVNEMMSRLAPGKLIVVDPYGRVHDPEHRSLGTLAVSASVFVDHAQHWTQMTSTRNHQWLRDWHEAECAAKTRIRQEMENSLWEGWIAQTVTHALPEGSTLHIANSMPIRDVDAFSFNQGREFKVYVNRGLNGIDGTMATSAGEMASRPECPGVILVGDLAFRHDMASLPLFGRSPVTIVVLDNDGGHIFDFLPISQHSELLDTYFITPQTTSIEAICTGLNIRCHSIDSREQFKRVFDDELEREGVGVIVVKIDPKVNHDAHMAVWTPKPSITGGTE